MPEMGETLDHFKARLAAAGGDIAQGGFVQASPAFIQASQANQGVDFSQMASFPTTRETPSIFNPTPVIAGVAGALGLGALAAPAAALYGISQAVGVQYPWETGPGEGFISPFTRDIVKDESGKWVTRATRPDLFNGGMTTALATTGGAIGGRVVKTWTANGWPFAMTCDADGKHKRIHTVTKDGVPKSWAPYRSIVIGKTLKSSDVKRVSTRIKSHVKSLKKVLSILK